MLEVRDLQVHFGVINAIKGISFEVPAGKIVTLIGANGAGKSTLMRIVTGQLRGHSGEVSVYGLATPDPKALSFIGCAPQPISLYPSLTAWENLRFFGVMAGLSKDQIAQRSEWALEKTGLAEYSESAVASFSGGMQRRLNLAVALLHSPKLLLLDEPSAGVDPQSRNHMYDLLAELNAGDVTILLCTHIMEEAQRLCSGLTLLDRGERIYDGRMSDIDNLEEFFLEKTGRGLRDP